MKAPIEKDKIYRTLKVRIYPNKKQEELIIKTFGCVRYVYNYYLDKKKTKYEETKESINLYDCSKDLTSLKNELIWLKESDAFALQAALENLDEAYQMFFNKLNGYPNFRSKKDRRDSYRTKYSNKNIEMFDNYIKLPKLKKVKYRDKSIVKGKIVHVTISRTRTGKYFAAITYEKEIEPLRKTGSNVGIDVGIKDFCIFSNGEKKENPKFYQSLEEKLIREQRKLSKRREIALKSKKKLSDCKNYQKQRIKVARIHEKIANRREDFLQKLSTEIVKNHDIICMEDLNVEGMLKNKRLAKSISDVSWAEFKEQLSYKAEMYDKELRETDRWFPSSKTCSVCGYIKADLKLKDRVWDCPNCKTHHDRDINAAINILNEGLKQ